MSKNTDVEYVTESLKVALADTGATGTARLEILKAVANELITELESHEPPSGAMPAILIDAEAGDAWLRGVTSAANWGVTVTRDVGTEVTGLLSHADYDQDSDGMASIWLGRFPTDGDPTVISSESITSIYVH